ncbi:50S ribosomal protein L11 [Spiroplasma endosymbiont of Amphibalanus improvisus]|uniref:50S ribosomal protein L11 n=1 Tax=Spiroplasma endosymbiont of Amphibalanus improvisus TaxID=3066327 RepID=UPI00313BAB6B
MAKKITRIAKLEFLAGTAKPGPELASLGINMPQFCIKFNDQTKDRKGDIVPVVITAYEDKSCDFVLKTTPAAIMLKRAANIEKGSANSKINKVANISIDDLKKIAEYKLPDLSAHDVDAAMKIIAGTAKNMGITIDGFDPKKGIIK